MSGATHLLRARCISSWRSCGTQHSRTPEPCQPLFDDRMPPVLDKYMYIYNVETE